MKRQGTVRSQQTKDRMVNRKTMHVNRFRLGSAAAVALLLFSGMSASALTIGRIRAAAWLGQPLDASVQVQVDSGQGLSALCFEAEVFHGDTRQDNGQIRVTAQNGSQPQTVQVRIQSAALVDEPVVTVYLRETCLSKTSRRFVLLSEIPPDALASAPAPATPMVVAPSVAPAAAPTTVPARAGGEIAVAAPRGGASVAPRVAAAEPQSGAVPSRSAPAPARAKPAATPSRPSAQVPAKPKLKLDPVVNVNERIALLEAAAATQAAQAASSQAADAQRLQKMEQSLQTLMSLAAKNERGMAELRERLQQAEDEKYNNGLVYTLAGLLLAALGGAAYLWRRQRLMQANAQDAAWWDERERSPASMADAPMPAAAPSPSVGSAPVVAAQTAAVAAAATAVAAAAETDMASVSASLLPEEGGEGSTAGQRISAAEPVEIDLDDLLAVGAESSGAPSDMRSTAGVDDIPVADFPALHQVPANDAGGAQGPAGGAETAGVPEFPVAGEVNIDVSHLSLSPVEQQTPTAAKGSSEVPMLDFDLDGLDKPANPAAGTPGNDEPTTKG